MREYQSDWGQVPKRRGEYWCRTRDVWYGAIVGQIPCEERKNWELSWSGTSLRFEACCNIAYAGAADEEDWLPCSQLRCGQQRSSHFHPNTSLNFPQVFSISHHFHCGLIWFSFSATSCSTHTKKKSSWLWTSKFNTDLHCSFHCQNSCGRRWRRESSLLGTHFSSICPGKVPFRYNSFFCMHNHRST